MRFVRFPTVLADLVLFSLFPSQLRGGVGGLGQVESRFGCGVNRFGLGRPGQWRLLTILV